MKVKITTEVDAKETDTKGLHSYVVALVVGGIMEQPEFSYNNYQIIKADSPEEARYKYNAINNCNFYYGHVVEQLS